jgi:hypothetical protein
LLERGLILLLTGPNGGDDVEQGFSHPNDVRESQGCSALAETE